MKAILTFSIFAMIWLPSVSAQQKVTFKLNPESKAGYSFTMDMDQTVTQTVDDEQQTLKKNMSIVWDYDVLKKGKSGESEVKLTYKSVKMNQDFGPQNIAYDSDNPPAFLDPSMRSLASLPGAELTVTFAPDGRVKRIDGVDELLDKMIKAMELPDNPQKNDIISDLRRQFGADALRQTLEEITSFYPPKAVAVGEKWNRQIDVTAGFPMKISSEYALTGVNGDTAAIEAFADVASGADSGAVTMGELKMQYAIEGTQAETIMVALSSGLPIRSQTSLQFDGTVTVSGVDDSGPRTWPISSEGVVTVTFARRR